MDNLWFTQKSNNKTSLRFRSGRMFLPITPLEVSLSLPMWPLKSYSRTRKSPDGAPSSTPLTDPKKTRYSELSFGAYVQTVRTCSPTWLCRKATLLFTTSPGDTRVPTPSRCLLPRAIPDWIRVQQVSLDWFQKPSLGWVKLNSLYRSTWITTSGSFLSREVTCQNCKPLYQGMGPPGATPLTTAWHTLHQAPMVLLAAGGPTGGWVHGTSQGCTQLGKLYWHLVKYCLSLGNALYIYFPIVSTTTLVLTSLIFRHWAYKNPSFFY